MKSPSYREQTHGAQQVLIVGGSGFIGRHIARRLTAAGWRVFATQRTGKPGPVLPHVHWLPCDLAAVDATTRWPKRMDAVIYLAQSSSWRSFPAGSQDVFAVNVAGLMQAAWYALRSGVRCFIYVSSGSVHGQTECPATVSAPIDVQRLQEFYPASKLAGEILLRPFQSQFATIILRLFMPYGCGQNPSMLVARLIHLVRQGLKIQLHGEDGLLANPVAVADVAQTLERCLHLTRSHTFNVAGPECLTLRAIGETIGAVVGQAPVFNPRPSDAVPVILGDTSALEAALGWVPPTVLKSGLQQWLTDESAGHADQSSCISIAH